MVLTCRLEDVAWHAGTDNNPLGGQYGRTLFWRVHNINPYSIGIELEGFADARDGSYITAQVGALRRVTDALCARYAIPRQHTLDQIDGLHTHQELSTNVAIPATRSARGRCCNLGLR